MRAGFTVTFETETRDVTVTLPDYFEWSKWSGQPIEKAEGTVEDMVRLIHLAELRTGATSLGFNEWAATIIDIDRRDVVAPKATPKRRGSASGANSK